MKRRSLLALGVGSAATLAVAGGAALAYRAAWADGRLTPVGRIVMGAVARTVLNGLLPAEEAARRREVDRHLVRLDRTIAAFPLPVQDELALLLSLLAHPAGRWGLAGLVAPWEAAAPDELGAALERMRRSALELRQQAYHALRDLTNAAYFAEEANWPAIGYPGPKRLS
jgi:hypothetical protein